ncbi:MAG: hypothetical protein MJE77_01930 [Proteobacteria bacterium]|nr:hypothetical protein [Pseudomonadota bacterium]
MSGSIALLCPRSAHAQNDSAGAARSVPGMKPVATQVDSGDTTADRQESVGKREPVVDKKRRELARQEAMRSQLQTGQGDIHIYQLVEEMVDEVMSDLDDLNSNAVSPMAIRQVRVSSNLSAPFADMVEGTLLTAIAGNTTHKVKRCAACGSLRSRVEDGQWVVTLGLVHHGDLQREAARLGVRTFLTARLSYFPGANIVAMQIEIVRAEDGAVLWTETYRSDATTAAILRTGDRVISRVERVRELERKLRARPHYGHIAYFGASYIPYDSPKGGLTGASLGYRIYEKFGAERRWMFGIGGEGFGNFRDEDGLFGAFLGASLLYEIFAPNLNRIVIRTGPTVSGFFSGTEGNSAAAEWGVDVTLQFRLGFGASVMYFRPTKFLEKDLGGLGYKVRASFIW